MLTWRTVKIQAHLNGYTYTITQVDEPDDFYAEVTDPEGVTTFGVRASTLEEAKELCENMAAEVQAQE